MGYEVYRGRKFSAWLADRDWRTQAIIVRRLKRVEKDGNLGKWKSLTGMDGLCELIIDYGPGYRVYFGFEGKKLIVVTGGSDKTTGGGQKAALEIAHKRWLYAKEYGHERI